MKNFIAGFCLVLSVAFFSGCNSQQRQQQAKYDALKVELTKNIDAIVVYINSPEYNKSVADLNKWLAVAAAAETEYLQAHKNGKTADLAKPEKAYAEAAQKCAEISGTILTKITTIEQEIDQCLFVMAMCCPEDHAKAAQTSKFMNDRFDPHRSKLVPVEKVVEIAPVIELANQQAKARKAAGEPSATPQAADYLKASQTVLAEKAAK